MRKKKLRIGGASGYWGDASSSTKFLLAEENLDVLVYDYLAEITMAIMARANLKDETLGYATDFVFEVLDQNLAEISNQKVKVVSNAGGMNPIACASAIEALIKKQGLDLKVGVVLGDNLLNRASDFQIDAPTEMFSKRNFPEKDSITSINAYLGAFPIAKLLNEGIDIVITGRCVDSALTLGACISFFNWNENDLDLLAAGSLVGHLIECGTQVTGGNFTDWKSISGGFEKIGYPIAEISSDGKALIQKPTGSGGIINFGTVAEQLVYEIGDPANYILPDVTCDFSSVKIKEVSSNSVEVSGAKGYQPPDTLKVCLTYSDGYRGGHLYGFYGMEAVKKAEAYSHAVISRAKADLRNINLDDFTEVSTEILGSEAQFGKASKGQNNREVFVKIAVKHPSPKGVDIMLKAATGLGLSSPPGLSGFAGARPKPTPVLALFSFLISKEKVPISTKTGLANAEKFNTFELGGKLVERDNVKPPSHFYTSEKTMFLPLVALAYSRSGDKGDKVNIGVIARSPELYPFLWSILTEVKVKNIFEHFLKGPVERFPIPGFNAINFVLSQALGGGGTTSLRNDPQGKGYGQILLSTEVLVPKSLVPKNWLNYRLE